MKKRMVMITLLFCSVSLFSQTLYVKLKQSLEQSQPLLDKVSQEFTVDFIQNEKTSTLLNAPIYKIHHSLNESEVKQLYQLLNEDEYVAYASLMFTPPAPPNDIPPVTGDFVPRQLYLKEDPGVGALYGWTQGADGSNVNVRLLEYGLNVDHEEFTGRNARVSEGMSISSEASSWITEHGTATAGIIYGHNGDYGVTGIAHNADGLTLYPEWQDAQDWDRIEAVTNAVREAAVGDVMVYEMQIWGPIDSLYVPAEYDPLVWDLTRTATDRGDSGAIIVGASEPNLSHATYPFSTHGSRVNINAWGMSVFTTGYGYIQVGDDFNQNYTSGFNGTSSATAVSGGFVAALQSYYHSISGGQYLTSIEMRDLLAETGIPQDPNETRPTGVFITMRSAIERLNVLSNDDESFGDRLIVYPNPTEGFVTIKNENLTSGQLEVYDSLGKRLLQQTITKENTQVDLTPFSQGIYFVKIVSGSKSGIKRIVKQ
jgi:hypothetical protein